MEGRTKSIKKHLDPQLKILTSVKENNISEVVTLLRTKQDLEVRDDDACTALLHAVTKNNLPITALLLENGACVDTESKDGRTPLLEALTHNNNPLMYLLLSKYPLPSISSLKTEKNVRMQHPLNKALIEAINRFNAELALHLVMYYGRYSVQDCMSSAPSLVLLAMSMRHKNSLFEKVALELVKAGALVNIVNEEGWSPLLMASSLNLSELAIVLLKNNANVNVQNKWDCTPLLYAAFFNNIPLAKKLLKAGANHLIKNQKMLAQEIEESKNAISIFAQETWTPFLLAAKNRSEELLEVLLAKAGVLTDTLSSGQNALHLVVQANDEKLVWRLAQLINAHTEKKEKDSLDVNSADNEGSTPLHLACEYGLMNLIMPLIHFGALINQQDNKGRTPLYIAVYNNHLQTVHTLLQYTTIDVNRVDNNNWSPLYVAVDRNNWDIIKALLTAGAIWDGDGNSPQQLAKAHGNQKITDLFLAYDRVREILIDSKKKT